MNILYIDNNSAYHRIDMLDEELARLGHRVERVGKFDAEKARRADAVWVEMATGNAMAASWGDFDAPLIVRLSAMEIYRSKLHNINWERVRIFLTSGQHLKDYFLGYWGKLPPDRIRVIPTGIPMSAFPMRQGKASAKIAAVSQVHWRKGVQLIPDVLRAIPTKYRIDLIGKIVDHDAKNYLNWRIEKLGLEHRFSRVKFKWPRNELVQWLHGYIYLLHPSYTEGMPRAVNEAMACGLMPLVHRFRGADALYPKWCIWDNVEEIPAILEREVNPQEYRQYITEHYSLKLAGQRADGLLKELV